MSLNIRCAPVQAICAAFAVGLALGCGDAAKDRATTDKPLSVEEAREALIGLVDSDPQIKSICKRDAFKELKRQGDNEVEIGNFHCNLNESTWTLHIASLRHDFDYRGRFIRDGAVWTAVVDQGYHLYRDPQNK